MLHDGEEIYADTIGVKQSKYTSTVMYGNHISGVFMAVHMNPAVGKQLAMILRNILKNYEVEHGEIMLAAETYQTMGVAPEDW